MKGGDSLLSDSLDLSVESWNICIGGFLQHEGKPTGMVRLWRLLGLKRSGPNSQVLLRSWSDNFADLAELIFRMRNGADPDICIHGYSWGGFSATVLARELQRRNLRVRCLVLCDPVYRHWYKLGQWRALMPWSEIEIPANVDEVYWFRQNRNLPRGHELVPEPVRLNGIRQPVGRTVIHPPVWLECDHAYCDDSSEFHLMSLARSA